MGNHKQKTWVDGETLFLLAETARLRSFIRQAWGRIRELEAAYIANQARIRLDRRRRQKFGNLNK